jgi:hypothetical protein
VFGGGIRLGHPQLTNVTQTAYETAQNTDISIHNNHVTQNASTDGAGGGIALCTGSTGYRVLNNYVCGNFTMGDGAGIGHLGLSNGGRIAYNTIIFNEGFNQGLTVNGGGIAVLGAAGRVAVAAGRTEGAGNVDIMGTRSRATRPCWRRWRHPPDRVNGPDVAGSNSPTCGTRSWSTTIVNNVAACRRRHLLHDTLIPGSSDDCLNDSTAPCEAFPVGNQTRRPPGSRNRLRAHSPGLESAIAPSVARPVLPSPTPAAELDRLAQRSFYFDRGFDVTDPPYGLVSDAGVSDLGVIAPPDSSTRASALTSTTGYHSSNESDNLRHHRALQRR